MKDLLLKRIDIPKMNMSSATSIKKKNCDCNTDITDWSGYYFRGRNLGPVSMGTGVRWEFVGKFGVCDMEEMGIYI